MGMSTPRRRTAPANTAVAYLRVSTQDQAEHGVGLDVQRQAIAAYATGKCIAVVAEMADEGISGSKGIDARPGLAAAVAAVESGKASSLIVAKMDRLSRSLVDTAQLINQAERNGWSLVFVDVDLNMATPAGKFAAHAMAAGNELVRGLIAERTKAALAIRKAQGVRLGRPSTLPAEVVARIVAAKAAGLSLRAIAAALTADGIATAQGGAKWHASTIKAVIEGQDAAKVNA
jgi:DNA invertase Pin-like site-specific DNA recombinase